MSPSLSLLLLPPVTAVIVHDVESPGHVAVAVVTKQVVHPFSWGQNKLLALLAREVTIDVAGLADCSVPASCSSDSPGGRVD